MAKGILRDLGPCQVLFDGTSLGENMSVVVRASDDTAEVKTARTGTAPVDQIYNGSSIEVEVNSTRTQLAQFIELLPGASGTGTSGNQMVVRSTVGRSARDNAKTLVIKPMIGNSASTNNAEWLTVFLAAPMPDLEFTYDEGSQRLYKVMFQGFVVESNDEGQSGTKPGWLWKVGA